MSDLSQSEQILTEKNIIPIPRSLLRRVRYTVAYKQRVGSEDVFLGINGRDPGSHCCEDLVIKVRLTALKSAVIL